MCILPHTLEVQDKCYSQLRRVQRAFSRAIKVQTTAWIIVASHWSPECTLGNHKRMRGAFNPYVDIKVRIVMPRTFINNDAPLLGHFLVVAKRTTPISPLLKELC